MQNKSQILKNQLVIAFSVVLMLMFGVSVAYAENPTITGIFPSVGTTAGGTTVTITGTNFVVGATSVMIGGTAANAVNVTSTTSLICTTPPGFAGTVDVIVTVAGAAEPAIRIGGFTYTAGGMNGRIFGTVTDILTKSPIGNVNIKSNQKYSAITDQNGYYNIENHPPGAYTLVTETDGYQAYNISGYLYPSGVIKHDIPLCPLTLPKGDLNGNKAVDLQDAISALKVLAGLGFSGCYSDVNGDNKIGLEEVIYILQIAAGLK